MLESGLPVWATDAGATDELASYFPRQLREFPPDSSAEAVLDDLQASGYLDTFNWSRIAESYLTSVEALLR
jgi:hypothetical protein